MSLPVTLLLSDQLPLDERILLMHCAEALEANRCRVEAIRLAPRGSLKQVTLPGFHIGEDAEARETLSACQGPVLATDDHSAEFLAACGHPRGHRLVLDPLRTAASRSGTVAGSPLGLPTIFVGHPAQGPQDAGHENPIAVPLPVGEPSGSTASDRPYDLCMIVEGEPTPFSAEAFEAVRTHLDSDPDFRVGILGLETTWLGERAHYLGEASSSNLAATLRSCRCLLGPASTQLHMLRIAQALEAGCGVIAEHSERTKPLGGAVHSAGTDRASIGAALGHLSEIPGTLGEVSGDGLLTCTLARFTEELADSLGMADRSVPASAKPRVSVVIPTKNATGEFRYLLTKLNEAEREFDVETIVIDSGSTDETLELAEMHGARIIRIPPEEFSHSGTRNRAAAAATGDYLLFMSQDVIPIGSDWLHRLMAPLLADARTVVAHARDVPRYDADIFMCWLARNAYQGLGWDGDFICGGDGTEIRHLPSGEKRRLAQLADTCCLVRKDVFDEFQFSDVTYGEDLDMGYRLLLRGYRLAHMHSVGLIHSHNRSPMYFLKRTYVDATVVPSILEAETNAAEVPLELVFGTISQLYLGLKRALESVELEGPSVRVFSRIVEEIDKPGPVPDVKHDPEMDEWIRTLPRHIQAGAPGGEFLVDYFGQNLRGFAEHFVSLHSTTNGIGDELRLSIYKVFGVTVGAVLGTLVAGHPKMEAEMRQMHAELSGGV